MTEKGNDPVVSRVISERNQDHVTRKHLFHKIEKIVKKPVVTFFTSFTYPVSLSDKDVDMLAGILQMMDLSNGLILVISSPGGDGLAAERMIKVCRSYSGTGEYCAIVPGKAKSAATMVCFGASKIYMGTTSELGPVDPQVTLREGDAYKRFSVFNIVESYKELFEQAAQAQGNLEPYLQQLSLYDAREIKEFESALSLSEDISVNALSSGMMNGKSDEEIRDKIKVFLTPESKKTHGRPIYREEALDCDLHVEMINEQDELWDLIYELYLRTSEFVSSQVSKCIESSENSFVVSAHNG
jgi:ClpP class serine protease